MGLGLTFWIMVKLIVILTGDVALSLMVRSVSSSDVPKINGPFKWTCFELV